MNQIIENFEKLTESEKRVCNYVVQNYQNIIKMNINDLADITFSSKTVVINMSKKLGFDGFADLKYYLKSSVINEPHPIRTDLFNDSVLALTKMTGGLVNYDNLSAAASVVLKAKTVYIAARGTSKAVAQHLEHLLLTKGIKCILLDDYNLLSIIAPTIDRHEAIILISLSGETKKIVETAQTVKARGAKIVAITAFTHNTVSRVADVKLFTASDSVETKHDDGISRIGMFMIVEMLVNEVSYNKDLSHKV